MAKYLDETGLAHLIKKNDARYVRQEAGKGLSANDFTDEYKQMIDDLSYVQIAINSISATNSDNEIGSTVQATTVTWALNKEPKTQKIKFSSEAEESLETDARSKAYTGKNVTSNSIIKLTVTDERNASVSKQVTIQFRPKVYYGVSNDPNALESDAIRTYTLPGEGKYIGNVSYYVQDEEKTQEMLTEIYQVASGTTEETDSGSDA